MAQGGRHASSGTSGKCTTAGRGGSVGVMTERNISKMLKEKVLRACVTPACMYVLEAVAPTEQ